MIEKNIRLQPHHARDLLVGRRSDGRRPGYQPPGHRDAPSPSRGGPPGGGGGHHAPSPPSRPAPAPSRPAPSPHRDPEPAARVEPRVSPVQSVAMTGGTGLTGMTQTQAANVMAASEVVNRDQTGGVTLGTGTTGVPNIPVTTGEGMIPGPIQGVISQPNIPITRGGGADVIPEFVPRKTTTVTGGIPHTEGPIDRIVYEPREGPARTYDPRTDPNALLQRGSGIMGTAKDKATQMAKDFAQRKVMKALGLGAFNPFLGVGSWLLDKFAPGAKAKLTSKFKYTGPKTDTQEETTKKLVKHEPVDRDGQQETTIQEAVAGKKSLGIDFEDIRKKQSIMKTALDEGWYLDNEGRRIQLTDQQKKCLLLI